MFLFFSCKRSVLKKSAKGSKADGARLFRQSVACVTAHHDCIPYAAAHSLTMRHSHLCNISAAQGNWDEDKTEPCSVFYRGSFCMRVLEIWLPMWHIMYVYEFIDYMTTCSQSAEVWSVTAAKTLKKYGASAWERDAIQKRITQSNLETFLSHSCGTALTLWLIMNYFIHFWHEWDPVMANQCSQKQIASGLWLKCEKWRTGCRTNLH